MSFWNFQRLLLSSWSSPQFLLLFYRNHHQVISFSERKSFSWTIAVIHESLNCKDQSSSKVFTWEFSEQVERLPCYRKPMLLDFGLQSFFDHIRVPGHRFFIFYNSGEKIVSFVNFLKNRYMYFTSSIALEQFNLVTCEIYYLQAMGVENYQV